MPAAISAKAPSKLEVRGWNLPQPAVPWTIEPGDGGVGGRFFRAGSANTVSLKRVEHAVVVEVEPNGRAKPQAVVVPLTVSGRIAQDKDRDVYEFEASKGKALRLSVESRRLGFPLDPVLRVTDSKGKTLNETDSRSADKVDEAISWTPPSDGRFRVEVRDLFEHGGERFVYRLTIEPQPVTVTATVEKDVWTLVGEKPLEIKVTLSRIGGFDKAVRFELAECPEGVMVEPVTSEPKGDSAKAITLKLTQKPGAKLGGGRLRIVGRVEGVAEPVALATAPIARLKDRTEHLWLVVKPAEKKKDKKK
jgi:hypothetical protein